MAKNKKQAKAAAAKRKAKQQELLAIKTGKAQKEKAEFERLVAVVAEVYPHVKKHYDEALGDLDTAQKGGACIPMSLIGQVELEKRGIKAEIVGGRAAFGFNMGKFGVVDFGYQGDHNWMPFADEGIQSFNGHAWLEVEGVDAVIDLSLPMLPESILRSNAAMGIQECEEYMLDTSKLVVRRSEMITESVRQTAKLGYYYSKPIKDITQRVHTLSELSRRDLWRLPG
jgi:hypothetical protein